VIAVCISIAWLMIGDATQVAVSASQAPGAVVTPAQAAPFIGDWVASVTSQMGPMTFTLTVRADDRTVRAIVASNTQPAVNVTDISLVRGSLLMKYSSDTRAPRFRPW
jgi:hypothetical protein